LSAAAWITKSTSRIAILSRSDRAHPDKIAHALSRKFVLHLILLQLVTGKHDDLVRLVAIEQRLDVAPPERAGSAGDENVLLSNISVVFASLGSDEWRKSIGKAAEQPFVGQFACDNVVSTIRYLRTIIIVAKLSHDFVHVCENPWPGDEMTIRLQEASVFTIEKDLHGLAGRRLDCRPLMIRIGTPGGNESIIRDFTSDQITPGCAFMKSITRVRSVSR